ncbi:hypothetical protein F5X97DRAFT_320639 [Nemania serpens]|nr:hypothetical protein F5X97DRAFT_320639 [Nemania serpens]
MPDLVFSDSLAATIPTGQAEYVRDRLDTRAQRVLLLPLLPLLPLLLLLVPVLGLSALSGQPASDDGNGMYSWYPQSHMHMGHVTDKHVCKSGRCLMDAPGGGE